MANSLKRELKVGDKVALSNGYSVVVAAQTFGNFPFTSGSALMVRGLNEPDSESCRVSGYDIDAKLTIERHAVENGWSPAATEPATNV